MIKPIPLAMLIHEAVYIEYEEAGRYGSGFKDAVTLTNVLVQPASSLNNTGTGASVSYNSLMFFDCRNSKPLDVNFVKGSKIIFNGNEKVISKVNPIYTFNLHHYEIELI